MKDTRVISLDRLEDIFIPNSLNIVTSGKNTSNPNRFDNNNFFLWTHNAPEELKLIIDQIETKSNGSIYIRLTDKAFKEFDCRVFTETLHGSRSQSITIHSHSRNHIRVIASGTYNGFIVLYEGDKQTFYNYVFSDHAEKLNEINNTIHDIQKMEQLGIQVNKVEVSEENLLNVKDLKESFYDSYPELNKWQQQTKK
jgi:hypothetical protein